MDARHKIFAVVGTVAIVATAGITGLMLFTQEDNPTNSGFSLQSTGAASNATNTPTSASASYKDGTYTSSVVSYSVPHGSQNSLTATVVISSGKISSVTTSNDSTDHESAEYVSSFESVVSSDAVGQSIASYSPSRIGGASLTTSAFDEAITDIAAQAKA